MTSTYDARGRRVGATVIKIQPNLITQVKTDDSKDGYKALQLGLGSKKSVKKPQIGHLKKAGTNQKVGWLKEVRVDEVSAKLGQEIKVNEVFTKGDSVKVTGISKGKGFQGGVRRWGFHGGPKTHGQSDRHRAPGSIGSGTTPGLVYKGKKMAGHMGNTQATVRNLEVIEVDRKNNLLVIKGGIPGASGTIVMIEKLGKIKGYTPPPEEKVDEEAEETKQTTPVESAEDQTKTEEASVENSEEVVENA